jgi:hypothetical protein
MADPIRITGVLDLKRKIKGFGLAASKVLKTEIIAAVLDIADEARTNFPTTVNGIEHFELSAIRQQIGHEFRDDDSHPSGVVFAQTNRTPMAAYLEFGTGAKVQVPAGYEDLAWQFYVNGKGTLPPYPYLIPAYEKGKKAFIDSVKRRLSEL